MVSTQDHVPFIKAPATRNAHYAYCDELGLQRWSTFQDAIDSLEHDAPNHLLMHPRTERRIEDRATPHPSDWPCDGTITTGENWSDRYSGRHRCTVREAACLQGFPDHYEFKGSLPATKIQVANAVPRPIAKAMLEEVKRSLMRTDALRS